ncbi:Uncharacterized ferredoxin-like protein YfaE [Buchnera aphidicola (Eriosoma lanigerum)]
MKNYCIKIIGNTNKIIFYNTKSVLLSILEKNKIKINYQCRYGYCGLCRVILKKGIVRYIFIKPIAYAHPGEIFPCCCIAMNNITITLY